VGILNLSVVNAEIPLHANDIDGLQQRLIVNVGLTVFPPFIQEDEAGNCTGTTIDKIISTFPSEQYQVNIYCSTPARVYRDLANSKIDLTVNVKSTKSMIDDVYFSEVPAVTLEVLLISYPEKKVKSIAAIRQFSYGDTRETLEKQGLLILDQANSKEAVTVFLRGGTDAIVTYRSPFYFYSDEILNKNSLVERDMIFNEVSLGEVGAFFVVNRNSKNALRLIEIINEANKP
jgi:polar amino acid transport system substrate-binding protein